MQQQMGILWSIFKCRLEMGPDRESLDLGEPHAAAQTSLSTQVLKQAPEQGKHWDLLIKSWITAEGIITKYQTLAASPEPSSPSHIP